MKDQPAQNQLVLTERSSTELKTGTTTYFGDIENLGTLVPDNYRDLDLTYIEDELIPSIKEVGVLKPVSLQLIRGTASDEKPRIVILDGHQRVEAVRRLRVLVESEGQEWMYRKLPCTVEVCLKGGKQQRAASLSVASNVLQKKETVIERALGVQKMIKDGKMTPASCASVLGVHRKTVDRLISIIALPEDLLNKIRDAKTLTDSAIYSIAGLYKSESASGNKNPMLVIEERYFSKTPQKSPTPTPKPKPKTPVSIESIQKILSELTERGLPKKWADLISEKLTQ